MTYIHKAATSRDEFEGEVIHISFNGGGVGSEGHQAITTSVLQFMRFKFGILAPSY